ncbi:hypothetical protein ACROYT_G034333 [Oculina patagonica]
MQKAKMKPIQLSLALCLLFNLGVKGDPCSPNPCLNGGTCNSDSGSFKCSCSSLYYGANCSTISQDCKGALGMESGTILDGRIFADSFKNPGQTGPGRGRLNLQQEGSKSGGWVAGNIDGGQWFIVQFRKDTTVITGVATQGRQDEDQWVTKYKLTNKFNDIQNHRPYIEAGQNASKVFTGNADRDSVVHHDLNPPIINPFSISFRPQGWHNWIAMRVELYGCKDACLSSPCENNGTCTSNYTTGGFTCSCPSGYTGDTCATGPTPAPSSGDPCSSDPCQNGGTCNDDNSGGFTCSCPSGYSGDDCSQGERIKTAFH